MIFTEENGILRKAEGDDACVIVPEGTLSLGDYAFYNVPAERIILPESLREIGNNAFYGCVNLEEIAVPPNVRYIGRGLFTRCLSLQSAVLPDTVTALPATTFFQCSSLTDVRLPARLEKIGRSAFAQCSSLSALSLPDTVTVIEDSAFKGCGKLTELTLPDGLSHLQDCVFLDCPSLRELVLPQTLKTAGKGAFETHGLLTLAAPDSFRVTSAMLDRYWNMHWNRGPAKKAPQDEHMYLLVRSRLRSVNLTQWRPEARTVLAVNYLETFTDPVRHYEEWIAAHTDECLEFTVREQRYDALLCGAERGIFTRSQILSVLDRISDPGVRARLLGDGTSGSDPLNSLLDLL